jgi:hypothetical protein
VVHKREKTKLTIWQRSKKARSQYLSGYWPYLLAMPDASDMVLRFVSGDVWGGAGTCREAARLIADYLVHAKAWDHPSFAVTAKLASTMKLCSLLLPLRWGAGPMAMLLWLNWLPGDD